MRYKPHDIFQLLVAYNAQVEAERKELSQLRVQLEKKGFAYRGTVFSREENLGVERLVAKYYFLPPSTGEESAAQPYTIAELRKLCQ